MADSSRANQEAMREADAHTVDAQAETIPAPDKGGHAHSQAAHLHEAGEVDTSPTGDLRHGSEPGALKQPPSEISRTGKQRRE